MDTETKNAIDFALQILKTTLVDLGVSIAVTRDGRLHFFDTETYIKEQRFDGVKVNVADLVN